VPVNEIHDHLFLLSVSLHALIGLVDIEVKEDPSRSTVLARLNGVQLCRECKFPYPKNLLQGGLCPACLRDDTPDCFNLKAYLRMLQTRFDADIVRGAAMIALDVERAAVMRMVFSASSPSELSPAILRVTTLRICDLLAETDEFKELADKIRRLSDGKLPDLMTIAYHIGVLLAGCFVLNEEALEEILQSIEKPDLAAVIGGEEAWDGLMSILALSDIELVPRLARRFDYEALIANDTNSSVLVSVGDARVCDGCGFIVSTREPGCRICAIHKPPASLWQLDKGRLIAWLLELARLTVG